MLFQSGKTIVYWSSQCCTVSLNGSVWISVGITNCHGGITIQFGIVWCGTFIWNREVFFREITVSSKIGKKVQFQKYTKTHFLLFQKWQKINFCTKFEIAFLVVLSFFSGAKKWFFAIFEIVKNVFLCFWNCNFFLILEHCGLPKYSK